MTEYTKDLGIEQAYCPICNKTHDMKKQQRIVLGVLGEMPVRYTELFYKCETTNYETSLDKTLDCLD